MVTEVGTGAYRESRVPQFLHEQRTSLLVPLHWEGEDSYSRPHTNI